MTEFIQDSKWKSPTWKWNSASFLASPLLRRRDDHDMVPCCNHCSLQKQQPRKLAPCPAASAQILSSSNAILEEDISILASALEKLCLHYFAGLLDPQEGSAYPDNGLNSL